MNEIHFVPKKKKKKHQKRNYGREKCNDYLLVGRWLERYVVVGRIK
jgi:hypothetical protein